MSTKEFKVEKLQTVKDSVVKAKVAIAVDFKGLSVAEITRLRRQLQAEGADITVVKNTLAKLAVKDTEFEPIGELLVGPAAIAFGFDDQVAPAKVIAKFIKETKKGVIKGGVLDGALLSPEQVKALADLPSREELIAKMLGSMNSPATGLVSCVSGVARALVIAMDGVRKQKESA